MSAVAAARWIMIEADTVNEPVQCFLFLTFLTEPGGEHP
jgi:hypothetical protein